jgi:hypothetical protein
MGYPGRTGRRRARRHASALPLPLALLLAIVACASAACASGDDDSEVATPPPLDNETTAPNGPTTAPPCAQARHAVAFDFLGTLTLENDLAAAAAVNLEVLARSGAADVATAYRDRGYEILYVSTAPADFPVGDQQLVDVLTMWLGRNGFPTGDGTRIWTWDSGGDAIVALVEELLRLGQAGVTVDAAYTDDADKAHAMASGGVPAAGLWTLGAGAGAPGSTAVPNDDLLAHVATVERLGMICQP